MTKYLALKEKLSAHTRLLYTIVFYVSMIVAILMIVRWTSTIKKYDSQSNQLLSLNNYDVSVIMNNSSLKGIPTSRKTIQEMVDYNINVLDIIEKNKQHKQNLSIPFTSFLHLIYTPSLDIWTDFFTKNIDVTLMGDRYLSKNPYDDIKLIEQWTDFFKDVSSVGGLNNIQNITVGSIVPSELPGYFNMNITVNFEAPDKRSFLLLVNKLSMTSYVQNIALIDEFMYYLWGNILEDQQQKLVSLQEEYQKIGGDSFNDINMVISKSLYDWVKGTGDNNIITNTAINKTIQQMAGCLGEETDAKCTYLFRQKVSGIPSLSYEIGRDNSDKIIGLKNFLQSLPPLLTLEQFSFNKVKTSRDKPSGGYKGTITIKIYGKDVESPNVDAIGLRLGQLCFVSGEAISPTMAHGRVKNAIDNLGVETFDTSRSLLLQQVISYVERVQGQYDGLSNYNKVIRLFELYRTLNENNLCDMMFKGTDDNTEELISTNDGNIDENIVVDSDDEGENNNITDLGTGNQDMLLDPLIEDIQGDQSEQQTIEDNGNEELPISGESNNILESAEDTFSGRTIGDGNSQRDEQLLNEFEDI